MALIEVVIVRDPDASNTVTVFVDGIEQAAMVFDIDPGAGYTIEDWNESRDHDIEHASEAAARRIRLGYDTFADSRYID